jgi:putative sensory transduction regulator
VIEAGMKAALAVLLLASSAGQAQVPWNPRAPENNQLLPAFSPAAVEGVLDAIGARHQRSGAAARPLIAVIFANNRRAVISLLSCTADGAACRALGIQASWAAPAAAAAPRTARAIQQFNQRHSFSKAFLGANGRPTLQRYLTADYGFVRGNLAVDLQVFANQAERFANEVIRPPAGAR